MVGATFRLAKTALHTQQYDLITGLQFLAVLNINSQAGKLGITLPKESAEAKLWDELRANASASSLGKVMVESRKRKKGKVDEGVEEEDWA